jgi:hypothetical protein
LSLLFPRLVEILAVDHEHLPDSLHRLRLQPLADLLHPQLAGVSIVRGRADLDQLMRLQRPVDLGEDFVGEAVLVADDDDRGELVRLRAQLAAP